MRWKIVSELFQETFSEWNKHDAQRMGAALSYYTLFSLAPLLMIAISVAGLVFGEKAAQGHIFWQIRDLLGDQGAGAVESMLASARQPATGILASIIGLLTLFFGASGVFAELRGALNHIWDVRTPSSSGLFGLVRDRFIYFAIVLGSGFLLLVSLVLSAVLAAAGRFSSQFLPIPEPLLHIITLVISFSVITLLFALIYKILPDEQIAWQDVWIGSAVTALLFTIGKLLIGLYLGKSTVASAYGAAGSLVIVLVWVYYSAQIFYFGAEFTHVYAHRRGSQAGNGNSVPGGARTLTKA